MKQESLGHGIIKAETSRNVIPPIRFGIRIELDHLFGSNWIINELYRFGFSISYDEVQIYKEAVLLLESIEQILSSKIKDETTFIQFVADNTDHNLVTLDGQCTLHGMAILAATKNKEKYDI